MGNEWKRTECKRGHKYVDGSWAWTSSGNRDCIECKKIREQNKRIKDRSLRRTSATSRWPLKERI